VVTCFIEIVPTDTVKYEVDKESGILKIDRPQKYSSQCPTLYGFIPRTFCGDGVGSLCSRSVKRKAIRGDGDPLDVCVLTERPIMHGDVLVTAVPIGGFRLIDRNEADDKIIAVLDGDVAYGGIKSVRSLPAGMLERIRHYFLTYKEIPRKGARPTVEVTSLYDRAEAHRVIQQSMSDYRSLLKKA
jgi:inorganic pyrophosphatase